MVVTIEPGLYFIPMLLDRLRASPAASLVDWAWSSGSRPMAASASRTTWYCGSGAEAPEGLDAQTPLRRAPEHGARQRKTWACVGRAQ